MPLGSSSLAPVTRPGPSSWRNDRGRRHDSLSRLLWPAAGVATADSPRVRVLSRSSGAGSTDFPAARRMGSCVSWTTPPLWPFGDALVLPGRFALSVLLAILRLECGYLARYVSKMCAGTAWDLIRPVFCLRRLCDCTNSSVTVGRRGVPNA